MYSNALKQYRYYMMGKNDDDCAEKKLEEEIKNSPILNDTEKQVIIKARIGQGKYRDNLMKKYNHHCVVTGIDTTKLLVASHIKPYVGAANESRLHIFKGMKVDLQPSTKLLAYLEYHRDVLYVK